MARLSHQASILLVVVLAIGCVAASPTPPPASQARPAASPSLASATNPPLVTSSAQPSASPIPSLATPTPPLQSESLAPVAPGQSISPLASPLPIGLVAVTLADSGLRLRSQPWVGDDSLKYSPLLPEETMIHILDGPVAGSGYWWYFVELSEMAVDDGIREGWVAAADRDGTPWVGPLIDVDPAPE